MVQAKDMKRHTFLAPKEKGSAAVRRPESIGQPKIKSAEL
jgi:hypothetical protein